MLITGFTMLIFGVIALGVVSLLAYYGRPDDKPSIIPEPRSFAEAHSQQQILTARPLSLGSKLKEKAPISGVHFCEYCGKVKCQCGANEGKVFNQFNERPQVVVKIENPRPQFRQVVVASTGGFQEYYATTDEPTNVYRDASDPDDIYTGDLNY